MSFVIGLIIGIVVTFLSFALFGYLKTKKLKKPIHKNINIKEEIKNE